MKSMFLHEMNWMEAKKAIEVSGGIVIIPSGSIEQWAHLPLGGDNYCAWGIAKRIAELAKADQEIKQVIILPLLPIGYAPYHMKWPGVLSVRFSTLQNYYQDITESLIKHGVMKFIWLLGHGGNLYVAVDVATNLKEKYGALSVIARWSTVIKEDQAMYAEGTQAETGHATGIEASIVFSQLTPEQIKESQAQQKMWTTRGRTFYPWGTNNLVDASWVGGGGGIIKAKLKTSLSSTGDPFGVYVVGDMNEVAPYGSWGDPRTANPEYGRRVIDVVGKHVIETVREMRKIKVPLHSDAVVEIEQLKPME